MSDIISSWLQDRLGVIVQDQKNFISGTKDGRLLAEILYNYGVIDQEALTLIDSSSNEQTCCKNLELVSKWLEKISLPLTCEEIDEIVEGKCSTIMSVLYRMFLLLSDKNSLNFAADTACQRMQKQNNDRFSVTPVTLDSFKTKKGRQKKWLRESFDIIHWHQDRHEALLNKCKAQREEYLGYVMRTRCRRLSSNLGLMIQKSVTKPDVETAHSEISLNQTYQELEGEKTRAAKLEPFVPDPHKAKTILSRIKRKQVHQSEKKILKTQLCNELLTQFSDKVRSSETLESEQEICEKLLKQSQLEKQIITKILEVKNHRETMMEDQQVIQNARAKEREQQFVEKLLQKDKALNEKEFQYYLEKERALLLHRQILNERIRLYRERNFAMCSDIIENILSVAMKEVEFKSTFCRPVDSNTRQQWYNQLVVGESFDDDVIPAEQIVAYREGDANGEVVLKEITKQEKLDQQDFQDYLNFEAPWVSRKDQDSQMMRCGMNILGYIVYRLLEAKYPIQTFSDALPCQNLIATVCVQGLQEVTWLPTLQRLLDKKKILVVETQDSLKFCLAAYKAEMKAEENEEEVDQPKIVTRASKVRRESRLRRSTKSKGESVGETTTDGGEVEKIDKTIQTPKFFPTEEPALSRPAQLGKVADEELSNGRPITDFLVIDMFKEYLRSKWEYIQGWVLVNYPDTVEQAGLLEEAFSGRKVPGLMHEAMTCSSIVEVTNLENEPAERPDDEKESYWASRLVENPQRNTSEQYYETILTAFIRMTHASSEVAGNKLSFNPENGELTWKKLEQSDDLNPLDKFYSDQGCNYSLHYQAFDFSTIKHLAKLIIGDYSIPPKTSMELFGDVVKYLDSERINPIKSVDFGSSKSSKKSERKPRPKEKVIRIHEYTEDDEIQDVEDKNKDRRKPGQRSNIIVRLDQFTQIPEVEYEYIDSIDSQDVKPGDDGWEYTHFSINDDLQIILATLWESLEQAYIDDLCQLFFIRRCITNAVLPYMRHVQEHLNRVFNRPDEIQTIIRKFQVIYNEFDDDLRTDEEFKAEIHCRVHELKEKLINICDHKMAESETERRLVIMKNWCPVQLIELINCYLDMAQVEINRSADSLNFVDDYYTSVINRLPSSEHTVGKEKLQKLESDDTNLIKAVNEVLIQDGNILPNPLLAKIEDCWRKANILVTKMGHLAMESVENMMEIFLPNSANVTSSKNKTGGKKEKRSDKDKGELPPMRIFEPDDKVKRHMSKIFDEWQTFLNGEIARLNIRLKLLKNVLTSSLQEVMVLLKETFQSAFDNIRNRYKAEIDSIGNVCEVFFGSTEDEVKIQQEIVFKDGIFYLDASSLMFPDPNPAPEPVKIHPTEESKFTFEQLEKLSSTLMRLAPSGVIPTRSLTFLLQDMVVSDDPPLVPKSWARMDTIQLENLVKKLFGDLEFALWKDFVICVMDVPFPKETNILHARKELVNRDSRFTELVSRDVFLSTKLWFEDPDNRIKALLYKMYATGEDEFNYTAMILDFCKSESLPEALGKALSLAYGKEVCWSREAGEKYVEETLANRKAMEEIRHARIAEVQDIIDNDLLKKVEEHVEEVEHLVEVTEEPPKILKTKSPSMSDVISLKQRSTRIKSEGIKARKSAISNKSSLMPTASSKSSRISKRSTKDVLKLQLSQADSTTEKSFVEYHNTEEDEITADETEVELQETTTEPTENQVLYTLRLNEVHEIFYCALPEVLKKRVAFPGNFHDLIEKYFNECRRNDFDKEVLAHEFLNEPRLLELVDKTRKFRPLELGV